jgi:hypothetical protein
MRFLNFIIEYIVNELIYKELGNNYYCYKKLKGKKKNQKLSYNIKITLFKRLKFEDNGLRHGNGQ